jgi:hypothetical protein
LQNVIFFAFIFRTLEGLFEIAHEHDGNVLARDFFSGWSNPWIRAPLAGSVELIRSRFC